MYRRIVLAYDGSVQGRAALREGALLARQVNAEVFLLSVLVEATGSRLALAAGGTQASQQQKSHQAVLDDGVARLRQLGFAAHSKLVVGDPATEIGEFAREIGADLVVVGHQRQSAFARWWSGPGGAYLIDHINCSMLVSQNVVSDAAFAAELARGETNVPRESAAGPQTPAVRPGSPKPARRQMRLVLLLVLPVAAIIGAWWYVTGGSTVSIDDAYVNADKVGVSTDVAGTVRSVAVEENQSVRKGQLLYSLDDEPFRFALARAEAQVGVVRDSLNALKSNYADAQAQLQQARYDVNYYNTEYHRTKNLLEAHVASQTAYDTAVRNLRSSRQRLRSLEQQRGAIAANLNGDPQRPLEDNPRYKEAVAQRDEAARELAHTVVRAPFAGVVTNVPSIAPGKYLPVMGTAFYLVATDHVWVDANPKETQLAHVTPGQRANVTVDTYPNASWSGVVESISPAAAQEFALLPAQNTSGNWVKVVQRIPMRVRVDTRGSNQPPLRAGMSVEVAVDTGHPRGLPHFLSALF